MRHASISPGGVPATDYLAKNAADFQRCLIISWSFFQRSDRFLSLDYCSCCQVDKIRYKNGFSDFYCTAFLSCWAKRVTDGIRCTGLGNWRIWECSRTCSPITVESFIFSTKPPLGELDCDFGQKLFLQAAGTKITVYYRVCKNSSHSYKSEGRSHETSNAETSA